MVVTQQKKKEKKKKGNRNVFSPDVTYKIGMKTTNSMESFLEGGDGVDSAGGLAHDSSQYIKVGRMHV